MDKPQSFLDTITSKNRVCPYRFYTYFIKKLGVLRRTCHIKVTPPLIIQDKLPFFEYLLVRRKSKESTLVPQITIIFKDTQTPKKSDIFTFFLFLFLFPNKQNEYQTKTILSGPIFSKPIKAEEKK